MVARELNRRRKWSVGLYKHFTRRFAASGPSGDLREKLERPLACAEIGQMQSKIGVDDADQRYIWKMQTLRDHLCAHEYVDLAGAKIPQRFAIRFLARHGVGVHAAHHGFWKNLRN